MALEQTVWLGAVPDDDTIKYVAREWRAVVDALVTTAGVCGTNDFKVTQRAAGANASFDVLAGLAVVPSSGTAQGKYVQRNNATANSADADVAVSTPAPPSSGTREHLIYLRVNDKQGDATATGYSPAFALLQDTGSGIPIASIPKNSIPLAGLTRRAGQTSVVNADIRDLRPRAAGLDASPYTSKTVPVSDRQTRRITTGANSAFIWTHGLGRVPVGGTAVVAHWENVGGSIPLGVVIDIPSGSTTGVTVYVLGTGAFGLHPSRAVTLSVELW